MTTKSLSLLEQKRIQWAKEREEMVGLCGLWGHSKYGPDKLEDFHLRKRLLPPIPGREEGEEKEAAPCRPEEESETSGYLSDSPKHSTEADGMRYKGEDSAGDWDKGCEGGGMDRKSYKNFRNERWARQSAESWPGGRGWWFGTPESVSSDDGSRLRWGDRGVGIGHLWEPVVHQPDSRLPRVESSRPTPKWVERGLRQGDSSGQSADILIIHHPDEPGESPRNFLLGQNVRLTPEVIEERERKRRRALEHQNAIRQQLEDRERKRKEERLNKLREERLEEERIRREQEAERMRMEEEQRRTREREEMEKRKEEAMREAIEVAERKAKEEKRQQRKFAVREEVPERECQAPVEAKAVRTGRTPRNAEEGTKSSRQSNRKARKDSSSQFEGVRVPNGVQFVNVNNLPVDGSLALVLDNPPADGSFLLPPESLQLALLMSPGNVASGQIIPVPTGGTPRGRVLTPSKFRESTQRDKTTQTDGVCCGGSSKAQRVRGAPTRKQGRRSGRGSGGSDSSEKSNSLERPRVHYHPSSKVRSRSQPRYSIDDRPKWGINRPAVQYKKQSEKDVHYQRRMRQRLKKVNDASTSTETTPKAKEEKLLESEMRLLKCDSEEEEEEEPKKPAEEFVLRNGYRMNSNPSSPLFVPIESDRTGKSEEGEDFVVELTIEPEVLEKEADEVPGSVGFVTQAQLEAIRQIASIREGLQKLQLDFSSSRSITPHSDK